MTGQEFYDDGDDDPLDDVILAVFTTCPTCGTSVLAHIGDTVESCAEHGGSTAVR